MDCDELRAFKPERPACCPDCDRSHMTDAASDSCEGCRALGSRPGTCPREDCTGRLAWAYSEPRVAECRGCDARFTVETLRTLELGKLICRVIAETKTGSQAEVGELLLREARASLRRLA